ncbi:hypothetical protein PRZ48_004753 [Zasmidium cellare]|uniref:Uncharacterized protein n=1 Tax=Zasmidium cellare TaxID=395010 RepID=A0ABR0ERM0_ZASCE|nr:hypothetical protein PRZ48_004753 [Zasmidium cellare]
MAPKRKAEAEDPSNRPLKGMKTPNGTPATTKANTDVIDYRAPASFLSLSAELRNQIYELALIEDDDIPVTKDLKEPGLLFVNRQIRSETRLMWFVQNRFEIPITDCAPGLLEPFMRFFVRIRPLTNQPMSIDYGFIQTGRNWANLMEWCRVVHRYPCAMEMSYYSNRYEEIIIAAHEIANSHVGAPWAVCERGFKTLRSVAGRLDTRWLDD